LRRHDISAAVGGGTYGITEEKAVRGANGGSSRRAVATSPDAAGEALAGDAPEGDCWSRGADGRFDGARPTDPSRTYVERRGWPRRAITELLAAGARAVRAAAPAGLYDP
jgi:hypothetical protein